jgi:hypothetical protein
VPVSAEKQAPETKPADSGTTAFDQFSMYKYFRLTNMRKKTKTTMQKTFETLTELATRIGTNRNTVNGWVKAKKLKTRRYGSIHRVYPDHWEQFLRECNEGQLISA